MTRSASLVALLLARWQTVSRTLSAALLVCGLAVLATTAHASNEPDALTDRIVTLEREGRSHPFESADALEQLLPATPDHSPQRLELLTVHGLMLALTSHASGRAP